MPALGPFARAFVAANRIFGAFVLLSGMWLLAACAWRLLGGVTHWPQWYLAIPLGVILIAVGIVYLRAPLWRQPREAVRDDSLQGH